MLMRSVPSPRFLAALRRTGGVVLGHSSAVLLNREQGFRGSGCKPCCASAVAPLFVVALGPPSGRAADQFHLTRKQGRCRHQRDNAGAGVRRGRDPGGSGCRPDLAAAARPSRGCYSRVHDGPRGESLRVCGDGRLAAPGRSWRRTAGVVRNGSAGGLLRPFPRVAGWVPQALRDFRTEPVRQVLGDDARVAPDLRSRHLFAHPQVGVAAVPPSKPSAMGTPSAPFAPACPAR